jgi:hypothetical protein
MDLIVTGPLRQRLYDLFSHLYAGRSDVHVMVDRRRADHRRQSRPAATRRRAERRCRPPAWIFPPPD